MCISEKPAAAPAAKKAAMDGKLFFVSEPQSIRVVESKHTALSVVYYGFYFQSTGWARLTFE